MALFQRDLYSISAGTVAFSGAGNRTVTFTGVGSGLAVTDGAGNLISNFGKGAILRVGAQVAFVSAITSTTTLTLGHDTALSGSGNAYELYAATADEALIAGMIQRATLLGGPDNAFANLFWDDGVNRMRWVTSGGNIQWYAGPTKSGNSETATNLVMTINRTTGVITGMALDASNIISGTIADSRLPARIQQKTPRITDANTATLNGWCLLTPGASSNGPPGSTSGVWFNIMTIADSLSTWATQIAYQLDDPSISYTRRFDPIPSTWSAWVRTYVRSVVAGAGISLSGANGDVTITSLSREKLTANRTYYVRTDGNNSNNGLANTAGGAFLTIQKAIDVCASLDIGTYNVTISVQAGTFSGSVLVNGPWVGSGDVSIIGQGATSILTTSASGIVIKATNGGRVSVGSCNFSGTNVIAISAQGGTITVLSGNIFGAVGASGIHMVASQQGTVRVTAAYTINGGGHAHYSAEDKGLVIANGSAFTVTLSGTPAFSIFAAAFRHSEMLIVSVTYSGSATGQRYSADTLSMIFLASVPGNQFPGSVAGSANASAFALFAAI